MMIEFNENRKRYRKAKVLAERLNLSNKDIDHIYCKFGSEILSDPEFKSTVEKMREHLKDSYNADLFEILKIICEEISSESINKMTDKFIQNEELTDFVVDLVTKKLLGEGNEL